MSDKKKILVADDDKDLVRSLKTFFESKGYDVATAHNGSEAIARIDESKPDAIVLDIMMDHDSEGFQVAYKLKGDEKFRRIPIIMLTGFAEHIEERYQSFEFIQGPEWPAAKLYQKPVKLQELGVSVERLISEAEALERQLAAV